MESFRVYGSLSPAEQQRLDKQKKKRIIIISVSSIILVTMIVSVSVGVGVTISQHKDDDDDGVDIHASKKAITDICQITDYKTACISGLSSASNSTTKDPKDLVKLSFKVAADHMRTAFSKSDLLKKAEVEPRAKLALDNCKELMNSSINELTKSFDHMGPMDNVDDVQEIIDDLKVWLSAAVTYQHTCLDGFQNTTGDVGEKMKKLLNTSIQLTSNTLAMVDGISSLLDSIDISNKRRLLEAPSQSAAKEDGFPEWLTAGKRRLLTEKLSGIVPNVVAAQDGSGHYTTINGALEAVPKWANKTFVIYVKAGVYKEVVQFNKSMTHVMLLGDGPTNTKITGNKNFIDGTPTFKTATVAVIGDFFMARDIGFENSAGAEKHQAVALRVQSDKSIFYNCQMDGYQDTLYAHTHRQFYRDCTISGTIDFIFGDSPVVFQNCLIVVRKPLENQQNTITAQGRIERHEPTALILHNCTIVADPEYYPVRNKLPTYLGRPWKEYSRTFIIQSWIDDLVQPAGWQPWMGDFALDTLFYAEFDNRGPGANTTGRVPWKGLKLNMTLEHAQKFTVSKFIKDQWLKGTGVPCTSGLLSLGSKATPAAAYKYSTGA